MSLLSDIEKKARKNHARIGLGVGKVSEKMIRSAEASSEYAEVVLIGDEKEISEIGTHLEIINSDEAPKKIVELLLSGKIDGAVRGTLSATKTLSELKISLKTNKLYRVALLETADGKPFFLAPVGIDEGNTIDDKVELVKQASRHFGRLGVKMKVGILSGGRFEDKGRGETIDRTLEEARIVTQKLCDLGIDAKNYSILIEDAIEETNFILAPEGISGNLIFRTLVFLGGGYGHGAPVLMDKVFVDTSRVGGNYIRAIMLAGALYDQHPERKN
ncbi:MAG: methanogenesis marker protein Mmp4/MtxX [Candidatus Methanoperedens sp.]|nr:methanogenesis marker protein Mmp4/MtxX [Candidatus Methanoperedens sp.]